MKTAILTRGLFWFSGRQLLGSLVVLFVAYPFFCDQPWGEIAISGFVTVMLLSALLAVGGRRRILILGLLLLLPALATRWLPHFTTLAHDSPVPLLCICIFVAFVVTRLLGFVLRAPTVDAEILASGVSIYLLAGLFWAFCYLLLADLQPGAFGFPGATGATAALTQPDAIYFSFSALTTAGYGDILPVSRQARMLANLESICGVLYPAILIARLVGLYVSRGPRPT